MKVGKWIVKDDEKMLKLGLVADDYKASTLNELWAAAEKKVRGLDATTRFHQEDTVDEKRGLIYSFRYYTPTDNRERIPENPDAVGH